MWTNCRGGHRPPERFYRNPRERIVLPYKTGFYRVNASIISHVVLLSEAQLVCASQNVSAWFNRRDDVAKQA